MRKAAQSKNFAMHRKERSSQAKPIPFPELHCGGSFGRRLPYLEPGFEVENQNEPTTANPISQHKQFKGHSTSHTARKPIK